MGHCLVIASLSLKSVSSIANIQGFRRTKASMAIIVVRVSVKSQFWCPVGKIVSKAARTNILTNIFLSV